MQIRELDLKELYSAYEVVSQLHKELTYKEFEDLVYDMRQMEYKMLGIVDGEDLITYAGVNVQTNLHHKRHLYVFELVTDKKHSIHKYDAMMLEYLDDYSRVSMCENIVLSSNFSKDIEEEFLKEKGFAKSEYSLKKSV